MALDDLKERGKALDNAVSQIEKQFGKGSIMRLGQRNQVTPIESISTGAISIDYALGIGGVPRGRVTEIYGPESSGKTTLALQVIASAHRAGGMAAFVDAEHALDAQYAQKLGLDLESDAQFSRLGCRKLCGHSLRQQCGNRTAKLYGWPR
jgi:recombination protein RecA